MNEVEKKGRMGRPSTREEKYKRTTIELPESILDFLATLKPSRTEWIIEAIREKREREEQWKSTNDTAFSHEKA